jgi:hypothetical protein
LEALLANTNLLSGEISGGKERVFGVWRMRQTPAFWHPLSCIAPLAPVGAFAVAIGFSPTKVPSEVQRLSGQSPCHLAEKTF